MDVYFAGANRRHLICLLREQGVRNFLISWRTVGRHFDKLLPHLDGCNLLLDPGYGTGGGPEDYVAFAKTYADRWDGCLAWDIPGGGAIENIHWFLWSEYAGLPQLVPVFHAGMPWRLLGAMQVLCGRVAIGGLLLMPLAARINYLDNLFYGADGTLRTPSLVAHGLGQDHPAVLRRYPWASVDSTTWLNPIRFGKGGEAGAEIRRLEAKSITAWWPPGQIRLDI